MASRALWVLARKVARDVLNAGAVGNPDGAEIPAPAMKANLVPGNDCNNLVQVRNDDCVDMKVMADVSVVEAQAKNAHILGISGRIHEGELPEEMGVGTEACGRSWILCFCRRWILGGCCLPDQA